MSCSAAIQLIDGTRYSFANSTTIQLSGLPITHEETFLHLDVAVQDRGCECGVYKR